MLDEKEHLLLTGMDQVFNECKQKACKRMNKPGNTATPWEDFSSEWLEKRLNDEIKEWRESHKATELIDIINIAVFLRLSFIHSKLNKFTMDDYNRLFEKR